MGERYVPIDLCAPCRICGKSGTDLDWRPDPGGLGEICSSSCGAVATAEAAGPYLLEMVDYGRLGELTPEKARDIGRTLQALAGEVRRLWGVEPELGADDGGVF